MIRIENWSVCESQVDAYTAPEHRARRLRGNVFDHPRHKDGEKIVTSGIVEVDGRTIKTSSGNTYVLGQPEPEYVSYCQSIGKPIDEANPIKVIS